MTTTVRCVSGAMVALALSACMVSTGEEVDTTGLSEEEAVSSVQQALVTPTLTGLWSHTDTATCPSSYTNAIGTGAQNVGDSEDLRGIYPFTSSTVKATAAEGDTTDVWTYAVCTNASGISTTSIFDSDGSATATCGTGKIAIGGGGLCRTTGAKLYRTRPSPDSNASVPTGWTASCNTGGVTAYARCIDPDSWYDFTSCRTRRVDASGARGDVSCPAGEYMAAPGGYCSSSNLWAIGGGSGDGLESNTVWCDAMNGVHAYAICCDVNVTD